MARVAENPPMDTTQASDSVCFFSMTLELPWGQSQVLSIVSATDHTLSSKHSPPPCSLLTGERVVQWDLFPRLVSVTLLPCGKLHAGTACWECRQSRGQQSQKTE